eukprot:CAMPEP_0172439976 /NCGR_PEP_ID=MMETSP1065-20121228/796_1 /TAXON_ID=265537 /ORGANISM="Amphiprora paludosa, Strain CCMP125" /LENGTH=319 /DNA_ID=CAMNT_0013188749 /DNA_START=7 /DNA_END=967 /DNA_ORIENTATION=-
MADSSPDPESALSPTNAQTGSAPLNPNEDDIPMLVHVTAPATLPAGYTFEAEINGNPEHVITCEVPEGGVTEGQLFLAPLPITFDGARLRAPVGQWKDNLFSFFNDGFCHAALCCALWCTPLAMGQVITRMNLSWLGEPGTWTQAQRAFKVICVLVGCYLVYSSALNIASMAYEEDEEQPLWIVWGKFIGTFMFTVYNIYSMCRTRETMPPVTKFLKITALAAKTCAALSGALAVSRRKCFVTQESTKRIPVFACPMSGTQKERPSVFKMASQCHCKARGIMVAGLCKIKKREGISLCAAVDAKEGWPDRNRMFAFNFN